MTRRPGTGRAPLLILTRRQFDGWAWYASRGVVAICNGFGEPTSAAAREAAKAAAKICEARQ